MARIIYDGQLVNSCLLSKDLQNFEPPYRKCWLRPCSKFCITWLVFAGSVTYVLCAWICDHEQNGGESLRVLPIEEDPPSQSSIYGN